LTLSGLIGSGVDNLNSAWIYPSRFGDCSIAALQLLSVAQTAFLH
jgi:hypothetical protein